MGSKFNGKFILLGDLNTDEWETFFSQFLFEMNAKFMIEEPNCSKYLSIVSCNDISINNSSSNFRNTKTIYSLIGFSQNCVNHYKTLLPKFCTKRGLFTETAKTLLVLFIKRLIEKLNQRIKEHKHLEQILLR